MLSKSISHSLIRKEHEKSHQRRTLKTLKQKSLASCGWKNLQQPWSEKICKKWITWGHILRHWPKTLQKDLARIYKARLGLCTHDDYRTALAQAYRRIYKINEAKEVNSCHIQYWLAAMVYVEVFLKRIVDWNSLDFKHFINQKIPNCEGIATTSIIPLSTNFVHNHIENHNHSKKRRSLLISFDSDNDDEDEVASSLQDPHHMAFPVEEFQSLLNVEPTSIPQHESHIIFPKPSIRDEDVMASVSKLSFLNSKESENDQMFPHAYLKGKNRALKLENQNLQKELVLMNDKCNEVNNITTLLRKTLNEQSTFFQAENSTLQETLHGKEFEIRALHDKIENLTKYMNKVQNDYNLAELEVEFWDKEIERIKGENQIDIQTLKEEIEKTKGKNQIEIQTWKEEMAKIKGENQVKIQTLKEEMENIKCRSQIEIQILKEEIKKIKGENQIETQTLKKKIERIKGEKQQLNQFFIQLKTVVQQTNCSIKQ
jgi:hypothetical protein